MSRILLYLILAGTGAVSLVAPWIGVIAYYILVLGNPQAVLFWVFADMRTSVSTSVPVILGLIGQAVLRRVSVSVWFDRQSVFVLLILVSAVVSYVFSPFGHNEAPSVIQNSNYLVTTLAKIVLFYFVAIALINDERKLHLLTLVIVGTIVYYTYWSNAEYLVYGLQSYRLAGPSIGSAAMYSDENYFCAVLVCGLPFVYYLAMHYRSLVLRGLMLLVIPFTWHAIFLTGSRGGLLGLIAVCGYVILKAKRVLLTAVLVPAFTIALVWQGGPMRQRGASIAEFEEDTSALGRLNAWQTGYEMMKDHPVTGVGIGNFMVAYRSYSQTRVRVAHSSVIQLGAETGVVAAVAYLLVFWNIYSQRRKVRKGRWGTASPLMETLGNATECSLLGFFVCSLFLNLATFEALYYLLVVRACWYHLRARAGAAQGSTAARPQVVEGSEVGAVLGV